MENGFRDKDKREGDLLDPKGGTYGSIGSDQKDDENSREGFEHRKGPLGPNNGRRDGNGD